jgi:hypothetical protein
MFLFLDTGDLFLLASGCFRLIPCLLLLVVWFSAVPLC